MPFTPTTWIDDNPPYLEAAELNRIEQGIVDAHGHIADVVGAHAASAISVDPSGLIVVTTDDVQAALAELDAAVAAGGGGGGGSSSVEHKVLGSQVDLISDTTLDAIPDLSGFVLNANSTYKITAALFLRSGGSTSRELKMKLTMPADVAYFRGGVVDGLNVGGAAPMPDFAFFVNAAEHTVKFEGTLVTGPTAGTSDLQVAQNVSHTSAINVRRGTRLTFEKMT